MPVEPDDDVARVVDEADTLAGAFVAEGVDSPASAPVVGVAVVPRTVVVAVAVVPGDAAVVVVPGDAAVAVVPGDVMAAGAALPAPAAPAAAR
ncbi:MAG: hypothetical protein ACRDWE_12105 [Acidimicrobiales bacterium]